jgi:S1-C subfamily serine protease
MLPPDSYDTAGHIVTNAHAVDGYRDRSKSPSLMGITMIAGLVVGIDPDSDLAVIQPQGDAAKGACGAGELRPPG